MIRAAARSPVTYSPSAAAPNPVSPLDAVWHLLNFFAAAVVTGVLTASAARLVWRRELGRIGWWRLMAWGVGPAMLASALALVVTGRDGRMSNYAAMVCACALGLWWAGFGRRR